METAGVPRGRLGLCVLLALLVKGERFLGSTPAVEHLRESASIYGLRVSCNASRVDGVSLLHHGGVTGFRLPPAVGLSPCQS